MNQPLFSVIIPHFNSGGLLQRLLDSIPNERDIQVIVVDDASSDGTFEQIESNPDNTRVSFIRSTDKTNAGVARNLGLEYASGEYLIFADSDDYFGTNAFNYFRQAVLEQPCDLTVFKAESFVEGSNTLGTRHKYLESIYKEPGLFLFAAIDQPCAKLIKRSLIEQFGIQFREVIAGNDVMFSAQVSVFSATRRFIPITVYNISQSLSSITAQKTDANLISRLNQQIEKVLFLRSTTPFWFSYLFLCRRNALTLCSQDTTDKDFIGLSNYYKKLIPKSALIIYALFKKLTR